MAKASPKSAKADKKPSRLPVLKKIRKRDGVIVPFDEARISNAISKAMKASTEGSPKDAEVVAKAVIKDLLNIAKKSDKAYVPTVEDIQNLAEKQLMLHNFVNTSKAYILYRQRRTELRQQRGEVPADVRQLAQESKKYFQNQLSEFVFYTTYSRWMPEKNRRETWLETVGRYISFMEENLGDKLTAGEYAEIRDYMLKMEALGSMRLLWSAGKAAKKTNICAYNCAYVAPTKWQDFAEVMHILMCGTGIGFSVEHQTVEALPMIKKQVNQTPISFIVPDSREGWCDAFAFGLKTWADGRDVIFDYSQVRPQGARLVTMGGRSSGPGPLKALLDFTRDRMLKRQGRRLSTIDVHDILCKTGEVVVAGGVRRSALISLSDLDDKEMQEAKNGQFWNTQPQRAMANNSAIYNQKPTVPELLAEWTNLVNSGSGERGIFNRGSLKHQLPARRWKMFEQHVDTSGMNPCGEIILRSKQFCNLSEVVARAEDTEDDLLDKVRIATILGTYQASLTHFPYLSKEWKNNCEEEALLGVSITGQWDCKAVRNPQTLRKIKEIAIETNRKYAARFGINPSTCITAVKPSGNGSQLFNSSSGLHPRHAPYYVRRVRIERHNPIFMMLKDMGVPFHPEVGHNAETTSTFVLEFPVKSPKGSTYKNDLTSLQQLDYWKMIKENYTEHNPSATISVSEHEWLAVANWVYENWDIIGGLSFLPRADHVYRLAPYEEITAEKYEELVKNFPDIDFSKIVLYEYDDATTGSKELACSSGTCEIDSVASAPEGESSK
jgi:ribonucleoside-diphosphate reductase alpha chain